MKSFFRTQVSTFAGLVLAGAFMLLGPQVQAASGTAVVKKVVGQASFTSATGQGALTEGKVLLQGARITTGAGSYVDLNLSENGDALRIEENSSLTLTTLNFRSEPFSRGSKVINTEMEVSRGHVVANVVRKLSRTSRYEIRTPNGVAGIRGTCIRAGSTGVLALIGRVEFRAVAGGGIQLIIGGQVLSAGANAPINAAAVQTSGLAKTATACTANTGTAAMVQQTIAAFATAIAAEAAKTAAQGAAAPGAKGQAAAQTAAQVTQALVAELVAEVQKAAAEAPAAIKAAVTQAANQAAGQSQAITTKVSANAAAVGVVAAGGDRATAQQAAQQAAQQTAATPQQANAVANNANTTINAALQQQASGGDSASIVSTGSEVAATTPTIDASGTSTSGTGTTTGTGTGTTTGAQGDVAIDTKVGETTIFVSPDTGTKQQ